VPGTRNVAWPEKPGRVHHETVACSKLGITKTGAFGVRWRGNVDMLKPGIQNGSQPVGEAIFDKYLRFIFVVARR